MDPGSSLRSAGTTRVRVVPAKAGTRASTRHRERVAVWIPALAALGRDDAL